VTGLKPQAVTLSEGESAEIGGYSYAFLGQREFAGITVRRDRSDNLIWIGAALLLLGLVATFWVPRRRLWAKISATRTSLAGQAPGHARYSRELRRLALAAGALKVEARTEDG
jgi:cytochrome c biogenesis protein ResB